MQLAISAMQLLIFWVAVINEDALKIAQRIYYLIILNYTTTVWNDFLFFKLENSY